MKGSGPGHGGRRRGLLPLIASLQLTGCVAAGKGPASPGPTTTAAPATAVSLTFDDRYADQRAAAASLRAGGLAGTFFVVSGAIGTPGHLSVDGLRELAAAGNESGGHTVNHVDLTRVSAAEATRQVCTDRATLLDWGLAVTDFAFPYADADGRTQAEVSGCGYNSARGLHGVCTLDRHAGCVYAETLPPRNRYLTRAPAEVDSTWTLADLQGTVTSALQGGGGWVQLTFHHVCDGCSSLAVRPEVLDSFLDWLKVRIVAGRLGVRTVRQVVGGGVAPAVRSPLPPPGARGGNAVVNSSLEAAGTDGLPACWSRAGFGENDSTAARVMAPHSGRYAERITVSRRVSGDVKLMPRMDLGQCSPTAVPGHIYALTAWYRSNARSQFVVYYRTAAGSWKYWTSGPWLKASPGGYAWASWTTPPVPADATGLSFGLSLSASGELTTDDYGMSDVT